LNEIVRDWKAKEILMIKHSYYSKDGIWKRNNTVFKTNWKGLLTHKWKWGKKAFSKCRINSCWKQRNINWQDLALKEIKWGK